MKFLHAADIHLDSPLRGLDRYEGAPVDEIRNATRRALENLVALAIDEEVDFVILAGDLFDGDWPDFNTGLFFVRQMARLGEKDISVYAVRGNHDAENRFTRKLPWPKNVHFFSSRKPESFPLDGVDVVLHGQSFANRDVQDDLAAAYPSAAPGKINIGVLHTSLDGRVGHASYAPTRLDVLRSRGYVEVNVEGSRLSSWRLNVRGDLLNPDAQNRLRALLESRLRAYEGLRKEKIPVPAFLADGSESYDRSGARQVEQVSEELLEQRRKSIEHEFFYVIPNFGNLIEKSRILDFEKRFRAYEAQLLDHGKKVRDMLLTRAQDLLHDAVTLIMARQAQAAGHSAFDREQLRQMLEANLERVRTEQPKIKCVYKGITYEHTQNPEFRRLVKQALPSHVLERLGEWDTHFEAAPEADNRKSS